MFLKCAKDWLLDLESFNFIQDSKKLGNASISVPFFLFDDTVRGSDNPNLWGVADFTLRNLHIEFPDENYSQGKIKYKDKASGREVSLFLRCQLHYSGSNVFGVGYSKLLIDGKSLGPHITAFGDNGIYNFQNIAGLGWYSGLRRRADGYAGGYVGGIQTSLPYGLLPQQFKVRYKGKELCGTSFVFIAGTWGILLDDDLSFDSLVLFKEVSQRAVVVDKFVHTVNPYVVKVMTLSKELG